MYVLTKLPCEPNLYEVLMNKELNDLKFNFKYDRSDTKVLVSFLQKGWKPKWKIIKVMKNHAIQKMMIIEMAINQKQ